jgi:hypothetical protein
VGADRGAVSVGNGANDRQAEAVAVRVADPVGARRPEWLE